MHLTLAINAISESNPEAVVPTRGENYSADDYNIAKLPGDWLRVFPSNGRDVFFLQCLEHRKDKFAPAKGGGVLIAKRCLPAKR